MQLTLSDILNILPHRPPMLMIDVITSLVPHKQATAVKNISFNEPCLQGHFPGRPIFPGALIVEAMAQAACVLAACSSDQEIGRRLPYLLGITKARFRRPVLPGDQLELQVIFVKAKGSFWQLRGLASVRGRPVANAILLATVTEESVMENALASVVQPASGDGAAAVQIRNGEHGVALAECQ